MYMVFFLVSLCVFLDLPSCVYLVFSFFTHVYCFPMFYDGLIVKCFKYVPIHILERYMNTN